MKVMKYINEFIKYKEYKGEKAIYRVNDNCGNTYYSDEYVNWLEEQLRLGAVVGRSEQLLAFAEFIDKDLIDNVAPSEIVERFLSQ